jgi:hypothetical protein
MMPWILLLRPWKIVVVVGILGHDDEKVRVIVGYRVGGGAWTDYVRSTSIYLSTHQNENV